MTFTQNKSIERKIGDRNYNRYLAEGVEQHKSTKIAPPSLLQPLSDDQKRQFLIKYKEIEQLLSKAIGPPTYSDSGFLLYCGDCCELLSNLERSGFFIDLTVTSPPYNIGKEYETPMSLNEYVDWCSKWMTQIYRITQRKGAFWLNVGYLAVKGRGLNVPIPYLIWDKSPFYLLQEVVWKYGAGVTTKKCLTPRNEKWLFFVKDNKEYTFNLDDIRDPNVKYPNQRKNGKYRCNPLGKNPSDVWEFPKVTTGIKRSSRERTGHPAQFPLQVVERIVRASSNALEIVFDPFAGSCSAGLAAVGLGRIFLGIEIESKYCQMAIDRYEKYRRERDYLKQQLRLF